MTDAVIEDDRQLCLYIDHLRMQFAKHGRLHVSVKSAKIRTLTQNKAIHKYCSLLSKSFNDAGLDMTAILKPGVSITWSESAVKEKIWHEVQLPLTGKKSTTELETHEVSDIYDIINRHISETFGVFVPFPSKNNHRQL